MPSSAAVHIHLQSRTASYRRFTIALVMPRMDGTTPVCCSTSPMRRWRPVPTRLSTLSTTWRCKTPSLRRGRRLSPTLNSSCWSFRCKCHRACRPPEVSDDQVIAQAIKALWAGPLHSHLVRERPKILSELYEQFAKFSKLEVQHFHKLE
jgi:hypothetical protein